MPIERPDETEAALAHTSRWRSLVRLADDPTTDDLSRRAFVQLLGAGLALAGLEGCTRAPRGDVVPYVDPPPEQTPGVARHYATSTCEDGYAIGLVVRSTDGRPTKVDGNARHPASLGATGPREQALLLGLYDPARARSVTKRGAAGAWTTFVREMTAPIAAGARTHVVLEPTSSPTLIDAIDRLRRFDRRVRVHFHAPLGRRDAWAGAALAFGRALDAHVDLAKADVVVALDADFLASGPTRLAYAGAFAKRRGVTAGDEGASMNRLYVVESALSVTGMTADHRLSVRSREVSAIAVALFAAIASASADVPATARETIANASSLGARGEAHAEWVAAVAKDLQAHAGRAAVIAGDAQPPEVHALAHAMNALLRSAPDTVTYRTPPVFEAGTASHGLDELVHAIDAGEADRVVIVGANPAYDAPADLDLAARLRRVPLSAYVGLYENETAAACSWFVPLAHDLESWGDARAFDGTLTMQQPLVAPFYDGRTAPQILAALVGDAAADAHSLVASRWRPSASAGQDPRLRAALEAGVVDGSASAAVDATIDWRAIARAVAAIVAAAPAPSLAAAPSLDVAMRADARVRDGKQTENAWLLELPDPVTKLTWDNAALASPRTAARLGVVSGDVIELVVGGRSLVAPILVAPGNADDEITLPLGYGRRAGAPLACGVGFDAYALRTRGAPLFAACTLTKRGAKHALAVTQTESSLHGRTSITPSYEHDPKLVAAHDRPSPTLYSIRTKAAGPQWGMTIDLAKCTGCSACVVACQAENNVPVVGKGNVLKSREMHWLRIDRYFEGDEGATADTPRATVEPMACQHCEKAPCEYVCPVGATVHSTDGLNDMVYNRCVGTRFCSNNCPYKVRRFNFFDYHAEFTAVEKLAMNPDVTVRARGVMEKCTYCVQRIRGAEIRARREQRAIADGEVVTACQEACPSRAIVFGDVADPKSAVSRARTDARAFEALHELGTVPRTRYLARMTNPNPELAKR